MRLDAQADHDLVIFGGEDHKTGQVSDTNACYARLEKTLRARIPAIALSHRWSGQVIETPDGLPYIGKMAEHQYAATGFGGNGMTFGTLTAIMISDAILGRRIRGRTCSIQVARPFDMACGTTSKRTQTIRTT
jgi:glycine/D-amino acid oxidase-like deaminating enzyme